MVISRRSLLQLVGASGLATWLGVSTSRVFAHGGEDEEILNLYMGELYFRFEDNANNEPVRLESGKRLLIRLSNEGNATHEIHFGRDADLEGRFYKEDLLGTEGEHGAHGFMAVVLEPGDTATMMFVIPETKKGEWEIGCFMPGHYEAGQRAPLIVS